MQSGGSNILHDIASGFVQSPLQIAVFFGVIAVLLFLLLLVYFRQRGRSRRLHLQHTGEMYEHLVHRLGLSRSERALVDRLAACCQPPDKKYLVLLQQHTFDACAEKLRERGEVSEMTLAALRLKLEFSARHPEDVPTSSADLPAGMAVVLTQQGKPNMKGRVGRQSPEALVVSLKEGSAVPDRSVPVSVYFHKQSGLFGFVTHVHRISGGEVYLDHSESISRSQRRRYYRRRVELLVKVWREGRPAEAAEVTVTDLSGGGVSVARPPFPVVMETRLILSFAAEEGPLTVPARVVRVSRDHGQTLHLQFEGLSEAARDRIIGLVFRASVPAGHEE